MSVDLPGDPSLPPGVTDAMTEARSMTPSKSCPDCEGEGGWFVGVMWFKCDRCDGEGVIK